MEKYKSSKKAGRERKREKGEREGRKRRERQEGGKLQLMMIMVSSLGGHGCFWPIF